MVFLSSNNKTVNALRKLLDNISDTALLSSIDFSTNVGERLIPLLGFVSCLTINHSNYSLASCDLLVKYCDAHSISKAAH